ncbi:hypothetical protein SKUL_11 [Pseudomonas phage Skulduggery]|uniref:Uncharacterized protein n=1 Tax=Pseudomonas phage Skulduggery TaxID=2006671 RepID=A0A1Y0SUQ8_9CAUD|nr:hypothetical protein PP627_gp11 [Pseudomonas phage Skulduggery]ARV77110.1 hypothetical protein SKUL_11 [Pseudomonas phage Skulduggery]
MQLTAEELAMLTPEEREDLLLDDEGGDDDRDNGQQNAGKDGKDGADTTGAGADTGADDQAAADAAAAAAAAGRDDGADDQAGTQSFQAGNVPLIRQVEVGDAAPRLAELEQQIDALAEAFEAGDKTTAEFIRESRALEDERGTLLVDQRLSGMRNEMSAEMSAAQAEQAWYDDVGKYMNKHKGIGTSNLKLQAFDYALRQITGDEANQGLTNEQLLEKAHKQWAEELGITLDAPAPTPKPNGEQQQQQQQPPERDDKGKFTAPPAVKTLGGLPNAEQVDTSDGKYAVLDRLADSDPLAFEAALMRMSDAERNEYMASA